ncbi:MAG: flavin reductase [Spirochaetales bacterium]|nr:flavin reductase [Spirochaetales bacterium]
MEKIDYKQLELNPFTIIGEDDFLLSAGKSGDWNTMTAGWGGFGYIWGKPVAYVFVRESRYTLEFMDKYDEFSLSFFPNEYRNALTICGTKSGRDINKAAEAGLTPVEADGTVVFEEANLMFTCKKLSKTLISKDGIIDPSPFTHYPQGDWHYMFVGEIKGVYIN